MSLRTDALVLKMLPALTPTEFTLLMALSAAASDGKIRAHQYLLAIQRVGLSENQAKRVLDGLSLHGIANLHWSGMDGLGTLQIRNPEEVDG